MKRKNKLTKLTALLLSLVLLLSAATTVLATQTEENTQSETQPQDTAKPEESGEDTAVEETQEDAEAEEPEKTVIHIASADDLLAFAKNCALDSWSQDIIAELDVDLSLEGIEFPMIPSFGGTFRGNGRTISGLNLSGDTSTAGLFRSIQEGGRIENLNVIGTLSPESTCEAVGGIAGVNAGTISGCSFSGSVSGNANTGGIAGKNTQTGAIYSCRTDGAIYGDRMTGGIAGCNLGTVSDCVNAAYINTVNSDETLSLEDLSIDTSLDLERLKGSQADVPTSNTDTGGIAGYSSGRVTGCSNTSTVGYPHVGYNVGGIIGRSCGYVESCENSGAVYGRKDVGGVIGQMEP